MNDKKVGEGRGEQTNWGLSPARWRFSADETFDNWRGHGTLVSADYASPNRYPEEGGDRYPTGSPYPAAAANRLDGRFAVNGNLEHGNVA